MVQFTSRFEATMKIQNSLKKCDCLYAIDKLKPGTVTLAYADPPWPVNAEPLEEYLHFLLERLFAIHRILKSRGSLLVHLPPEVVHHVRVGLDRVFGEGNYRREFVIPNRGHTSHSEDFQRIDYSVILVYSKTLETTYNQQIVPYSTKEISRRFPLIDEQGPYSLVSMFLPQSISVRPNMIFEWNDVTPPPGKAWRFTKKRLDELKDEGKIVYRKPGNLPHFKRYLTENADTIVGCIWDDILPVAMHPSERTGFAAQQSLQLMNRIVNMYSNAGDMVLDPFCGSGTTLVAAQDNGRHWIGYDISRQAIDTAADRMRQHIPTANTDFELEYTDVSFETHSQFTLSRKKLLVDLFSYRSDSSESFPRFDYSEHNRRFLPRIFTEGKTDWKHLKAALRKLKAEGDIDDGIVVEFAEEQEAIGDTKLLDRCRAAVDLPHEQPLIFVFDRDNPRITSQVDCPENGYKPWGNNVYSLAIPVPEMRANTPEISIEFYYSDRDLMTEHENGRRLFLSTEFDKRSGRHSKCDLNYSNVHHLKGHCRIIDADVYDASNSNVALSKNDFADSILKGLPPFSSVDFSNFIDIFKLIQVICDRE